MHSVVKQVDPHTLLKATKFVKLSIKSVRRRLNNKHPAEVTEAPYKNCKFVHTSLEQSSLMP